jgi:hypothetical protein
MSLMEDNIRKEARVIIKYYNAVAILCWRVVNEVKLERVLRSVVIKDLGKGL